MIFHFVKIEELQGLIILDPQWLADTLTLVIRNFNDHKYNEKIVEKFLDNNNKIILYDANKRRIRDVIKETITNAGGMTIKLLPYDLFPGTAAYLMEDINLNINNPKFWSNFLEDYPLISYGTDTYSIIGNGYCYGIIKQLRNIIIKYNDNEDIDDDNISDDQIKVSNKQKRLAEHVIHLIYLDFCFNQISYQMKLEYRKYYQKLIDSNAKYFEIEFDSEMPFPHYITILSNFNIQQFEEFTSKYKNIFKNNDYTLLLKYYWIIGRILLLGKELSLSKNLIKYYDEISHVIDNEFMISWAYRDFIANNNIIKHMLRYISIYNSRESLLIEILNTEPMKEYNDLLRRIGKKLIYLEGELDNVSDILVDNISDMDFKIKQYYDMKTKYPRSFDIYLKLVPVPLSSPEEIKYDYNKLG